LVAVYRRTADYGITENRYFLWLGAFWLLGVSLYMIFTKGKTFRSVLVSLACVALLSIVGPWSAFSVSECSQIHRLQKLLTKQEWLKAGTTPDDAQIRQAAKDYRQVREIREYFSSRGNTAPFSPDIDDLCEKYKNWYESDDINIEDIEIEYAESVESPYFEIGTNEEQPLGISGYDRMLYYMYRAYQTDEDALAAEDSTLACKIKARPDSTIQLYHYGTLYETFSLPDVVRQIPGIDWDTVSGDLTATEEMKVVINPRCAVVFTYLRGENIDQSLDIDYAVMYILEKK
jgi:hypothetical protein